MCFAARDEGTRCRAIFKRIPADLEQLGPSFCRTWLQSLPRCPPPSPLSLPEAKPVFFSPRVHQFSLVASPAAWVSIGAVWGSERAFWGLEQGCLAPEGGFRWDGVVQGGLLRTHHHTQLLSRVDTAASPWGASRWPTPSLQSSGGLLLAQFMVVKSWGLFLDAGLNSSPVCTFFLFPSEFYPQLGAGWGRFLHHMLLGGLAARLLSLVYRQPYGGWKI